MLDCIVYNYNLNARLHSILMVSILIDKRPLMVERNLCASVICYISCGMLITGIYLLGDRIINFKVYINFDGEIYLK